jgi:hypothetical protein
LLGVNVDDQMTSVLINEADINMEKLLKAKYMELGTNTEKSTWSKWKIFMNKWFRLEFPEYTKDPKDLVNKILRISNLIAVKTRRGPANFVIVSPKIASILQEDPRVLLYPIGNLIQRETKAFANISDRLKVFVDNYQTLDNETVIIGKTTRDGNVGVVIGECSRQLMKTYNYHPLQTTNYQLRDRLALSETGDEPYGYYTTKFIIGKKPIWRKLLNC